MHTPIRQIASLVVVGATLALLGCSGSKSRGARYAASAAPGSTSAFAPTQDVTLPTGQGPYAFSSVSIPAGVTVRGEGPLPLVIRCSGAFALDGVIDVTGADGEHAQELGTPGAGGAGGPGAGAGGDGAPDLSGVAQDGEGPGGGHAADTGGGAGFVVDGVAGRSTRHVGVAGASYVGGAGGVAYANPSQHSLQTSSGGAGGGANLKGFDASGPGGGGGGGSLHVICDGAVTLSGRIAADGGDGGGHRRTPPVDSLGAGGGAGGMVWIQARQIRFEGGHISARGGLAGDGDSLATADRAYGGNGSPGVVWLEDADGTIEGVAEHVFPAPSGARPTNALGSGTGALGDFVAQPGWTTYLDTTGGPLHYLSFVIPSGATVVGVGPNPLEVIATGRIEIAGTLDVSGRAGENATANGTHAARGGHGGPGAGKGGDGGLGATSTTPATVGEIGEGLGGGGFLYDPLQNPYQGYVLAPSGAGGGFGTPGQDGNYLVSLGAPTGGAAYGDAELTQLVAGSGGAGCPGAGGGTPGWGIGPYGNGSGGGGGGGAVLLRADEVVVSGTIVADGGAGGANHPAGSGTTGTRWSGAGSAGSGGAIKIQARRVDLDGGSLSARGGVGGITPGVAGGGAASVPSAGTGAITAAGTGGFQRHDDEAPYYRGAHGGEGRIRIEAVEGSFGGVDIRSHADRGRDHATYADGELRLGAYTPPTP